MLSNWIATALALTLATALPLRQHAFDTFTNTTTNATVTNATTNGTLRVDVAATSTSDWWFPNIDLSNPDYGNTAPNLGDDNSYPVYVAVASGDSNGLINAI